jgi:hypothetical protein
MDQPQVVRWERRQGLSDTWPSVFQYLSSEPLDINNLTLTCSEFRWIAQPLLFRQVHIRPFRILVIWRLSRRFNISFPADDVYQKLERLQFLALPRIAPSVHECILRPWDIYRNDLPTELNPDIHVILDAFMALLPVFVNLRAILLQGINLTRGQLGQLSNIKLRTLHLRECRAPAGGPVHPLLKVDNLLIRSHSGNIDAWLHTTQLDELTSLYLTPSEAVYALFTSAWVDSMLPLLDLNIRITPASTPQLIIVLSKLHILQRLAVTYDFAGISLPTQPPQNDATQTTLATLHSYNGPVALLIRLRLPQLRHLTINGASATFPCEPATLLDALAHLQEMVCNLDTLGIIIVYLTNRLAKTLFSLLPPQATLTTFQLFVLNYAPSEMSEPDTDGLQV